MKMIFNSKVLWHNLHKPAVKTAGVNLCNDNRVTSTAIVTAIVTLTKEKKHLSPDKLYFYYSRQKEQEQL